ncbi:MAG TPA: L,D-transpeptidase family protein [Allosphingosinicella sp.]
MLSRFIAPLLLLGAAVPTLGQTPVPANPDVGPAPAVQTAPAAPAPAPVVISADWKRKQAEELLAYVESIGDEGLDPLDYAPERLRAAIAAKGDELDAVATDTFLKVASDLMFGHVRGDARIDWHVKDDDWSVYDQQALLDRALAGNTIADALRSLLPTHPQYAGLKALLATTTDAAARDRIRINLDRWRWLPRDLGQKYVIVNVPAYTVSLVESGNVLSRRRAVAGALKTPTPQLSAVITGANINPWWEVPQSITKEVQGKRGYVRVAAGEGKFRYRQPPGPTNALGRVKITMPNPYAIYLHDTNAKKLFDKQARAYSHGCIRTEDAVGFAAALLEGTEWTPEKVAQAVAAGKTVQANTAAPIPVYIVYFTVASTSDGPAARYADMYARDGKVLAALNDAGGSALASARD